MLKLIALMLPLCLDTFVVAAALGAGGLARSRRLEVATLLASFEALMPLVGVAAGEGLGRAVGSRADYVASAALVGFGAFLLLHGDDDEADRAAMLSRAHGLAIVGLGIGISLDELAVGLSLGLLRVPVFWAVALIAVQAFAAAQLGVRVGARLGHLARKRTERIAAITLIGLGLTFCIARVGR